MVKVVAPGMSLDASGTLAGALVFSKWKGRNYIRQHVIPANPRYPKQVSVRAMFKFLTQEWKPNLPAGDQATWDDRADAGIYSPFNAYLSYNQRRWKSFLAPTHTDPALETGTHAVAAGYYATGGVRMATVGFNVSVINEGWGSLLFRSKTTAFDTAFDNLVAVMGCIGAGDIVHVDTPLEAGTYYYNWRKFTFSGLLDDEAGQAVATVT